ncbi:hypothetical protein D3C71_1944300 [compost metagenome]
MWCQIRTFGKPLTEGVDCELSQVKVHRLFGEFLYQISHNPITEVTQCWKLSFGDSVRGSGLLW